MIDMHWADHHWKLLHERAVLRKRDRCLILADPHFGKGAAFRAAGVPVPGGSTLAILNRLTRAIDRTGAQRLLILGDFFHAATSRSPEVLDAITAWRDVHPDLDIALIRGNHDLHAGDPPQEWNITCVDEPFLDGSVAFCHRPEAAPADHFSFAGHLHPAVVLTGEHERLRCTCFCFGKRQTLLPAFGSFTGRHTIRPARHDRVFIVGEDRIVEVKPTPRPKRSRTI